MADHLKGKQEQMDFSRQRVLRCLMIFVILEFLNTTITTFFCRPTCFSGVNESHGRPLEAGQPGDDAAAVRPEGNKYQGFF